MQKLLSFINHPLPTFNGDHFDPDFLGTGHFVSEWQDGSSIDFETGTIEISLKSARSRFTYYSNMLTTLSDLPIHVLNIIEQEKLSILDVGGHKESALRSLIETAKEKKEYGDLEKFSEELKKHTRLYAKKDNQWKSDLEVFSKLLSKSLFSEDIDEDQVHAIWKKLKNLHKEKHNSILPFLKFSRLFIYCDKESVESIVKSAHEIDPVKTYTHFVTLYRAIHTPDLESRFNLINCFNSPHLMPALKKHYPYDWLLTRLESDEKDPILMAKSDVYLRGFQTRLSNGVNCLIQNKPDEALKEFIVSKNFGSCEPSVYRYMAITWLLKGDVSKAISTMVKAQHAKAQLGPISDTMNLVFLAIKQGLSIPTSLPKQTSRKEDDLMKKFITLYRTSEKKKLQFSDTTHVLRYCAYSLTYEPNTLPMVYLILKWMQSKDLFSQASNQKENYNSEYMKSLSLLMGVAQKRCSNPDVIDPKLANIFSISEEDPTQLLISGFEFVFMPNESLGSRKDLPVLSLRDDDFDIVLTDESSNSFAVETCLLAHGFFNTMLGCFGNHDVFFTEDGFNKILLPEDSQFMAHLLTEAVQGGVKPKDRDKSAYRLGLNYLNAYLSLDTFKSGYNVDVDVIDWATFSMTALSPQHILSNRALGSLKTKVKEHYQPIPVSSLKQREKSRKVIEKFLKESSEEKTMLLPSKNSELIIQKSLEALNFRFTDDDVIELGEDGSSLWSLVEFGQSLFGWRKNESFDAWGQRLNSEILPISDVGDSFNVDGSEDSSGSKLSMPVKCSEWVDVLREYQQFWKKFHKDTVSKNEAINRGASDDESSLELISTKWCEKNKELWQTIISQNDPTEHPKFSTFSKDRQDKVGGLVAEKYRLEQEVVALKQLWEKGLKQLPDDQCVEECASLLFENTQANKGDVFVSLYVGSQKIAEDIYRLLLESSIRTVVATDIMEQGPSIWALKSARESSPFLMSSLEKLSKTFHGPESHLNGAGPIQPHYNAGVYHSGKPINTHIYFS